MRKLNLSTLLMAFVAMSFFVSPVTHSDDKTAIASKTLSKKTPVLDIEDKESLPKQKPQDISSSASPRKLRQHGLGLGIGQTFLLGNFSDHGEDKITLDLLYSYAASYSFDLLLDAHLTEHESKNEAVRTLGLASSIKARLVEYDNFSPFVLAGLGFYAPREKRPVDGDLEWSQQKITFGMNFGGGADLRLNDNYVVGLLGQMHWPFTIKQDQGSDVKGYYFKLLITGMYLF